MIEDVETVKRGDIRGVIPLPLKGQLPYFTEVLDEWLTRIPQKDSVIIPTASGLGINWNKALSRQRCHVSARVH
jgi:hypothetical protein